MFVTYADYEVAPLNLQGLDKVNNSFADFVTEQEEDNLKKLFGVRLWTAFKAGIAALPAAWAVATAYIIGNTVTHSNKVWIALQDSTGVVPGTDPLTWEDTENKWIALKVGAEYTYNDIRYEWVGMNKMVRPMIYSLWMRHVVSDQVSSIGTVKGKSENADMTTSNVRMNRAWNSYNALAAGGFKPPFAGVVNSLYGYLLTNASEFDSDVAPEYDEFTQYLSNEFTTPGRQSIFDV